MTKLLLKIQILVLLFFSIIVVIGISLYGISFTIILSRASKYILVIYIVLYMILLIFAILQLVFGVIEGQIKGIVSGAIVICSFIPFLSWITIIVNILFLRNINK